MSEAASPCDLCGRPFQQHVLSITGPLPPGYQPPAHPFVFYGGKVAWFDRADAPHEPVGMEMLLLRYDRRSEQSKRKGSP